MYIKRSWHFQFWIFSFYSRGEGGGEGEGGRGEILRVRIDWRTNICSPTVFLCLKQPLPFLSQMTEVSLKFKPSNVFLVSSKESNLYLLWYIKIWSVVAFLFIFQIGSAYFIYQHSQPIKVCKYTEENADEISQDLPYSKKHHLDNTVYFCLVPKKPVRKNTWLAGTKIFTFVRLYVE